MGPYWGGVAFGSNPPFLIAEECDLDQSHILCAFKDPEEEPACSPATTLNTNPLTCQTVPR